MFSLFYLSIILSSFLYNQLWFIFVNSLIIFLFISFLLSLLFFSSFLAFCFSVTKLCPTLCDTMDCSMPGYSILHCLLEFSQIHVHWYYLTIHSLPLPFFFCLQCFPLSVFSSESALCIRRLKYWSLSFSISPSNKYSGLISLRIG